MDSNDRRQLHINSLNMGENTVHSGNNYNKSIRLRLNLLTLGPYPYQANEKNRDIKRFQPNPERTLSV